MCICDYVTLHEKAFMDGLSSLRSAEWPLLSDLMPTILSKDVYLLHPIFLIAKFSLQTFFKEILKCSKKSSRPQKKQIIIKLIYF